MARNLLRLIAAGPASGRGRAAHRRAPNRRARATSAPPPSADPFRATDRRPIARREPPFEERRRAQRVDPPPRSRADAVLLRVVQRVVQRVPHLFRRAQNPLVVAVGEHAAASLHQPVERSRDPDGEPLHAARQRLCVERLDDEVQVIVLHAVVDDAHPRPARGAAQCVPDPVERRLAPQLPHAWARLQRDQHPEARGQRRPARVGDARTVALRLTPGTGPAAAVRSEVELALLRSLAGSSRHARRTRTGGVD